MRMSDGEREQTERDAQPLEAEAESAVARSAGGWFAGSASGIGGNAEARRWLEGRPGQGRLPYRAHRVLALQRAAGNAATAHILQRDWLDDISRGPWDALFVAQADAGLPRSLIRHYQAGTGGTYQLTRAEMLEVDGRTNVFSQFPVIRSERNRLLDEAIADTSDRTEWEVQISGAQGLAGAGKNQTLGTFTITLDGTLTLHKGQSGILAEFTGIATYNDTWDFDPKPYGTWVSGESRRTTAGELKTWVGATMEGAPFEIVSGGNATVNITQHQFDSQATIS